MGLIVMNATGFDTIHKVIHINTDKEELERISQLLNGLNNKWTTKAILEAKKYALEMLKIVREMHKEELIDYNEQIKSIAGEI